MKNVFFSSIIALSLTASVHADVDVGAAIGITGPLSSVAPTAQKTLGLVLGQVNSQGGLFKEGEKMNLITVDSACEPVTTVDAVKKLVDIHQVTAFVGPICSGPTIAQAQSVSIPAGVVSIAIGATSPLITNLEKGTDLLFRVAPSDKFQGVSLAELAHKKGITDIAVMYSNDDYNIGIAEAFMEAFKEKGGKITASQSFDAGKLSYRTQVTTLGKDAKTLALFAYPGNGGITILRDAISNGAFDQFIGADTMRDKSVLDQLGAEALKNAAFVSVTYDFESASFKAWEKMAAEVGIDARQPFISNAYDSLFVLTLAIEKAGSNDRSKVSKALREITSGKGELILPGEFKKAKDIIAAGGEILYEGASGSVNFDVNGDVTGISAVNTVDSEGNWVTVRLDSQ